MPKGGFGSLEAYCHLITTHDAELTAAEYAQSVDRLLCPEVSLHNKARLVQHIGPEALCRVPFFQRLDLLQEMAEEYVANVQQMAEGAPLVLNAVGILYLSIRRFDNLTGWKHGLPFHKAIDPQKHLIKLKRAIDCMRMKATPRKHSSKEASN